MAMIFRGEDLVLVTNNDLATVTKEGLMSAADKKKVDELDESYLKLTGGTVTGDTTFNSKVNLSTNVSMKYDATDDCVKIIFN